jgi:hypothetical protein
MMVDEDKKWDYALGLIKIDGLKPSPEFMELVEKEKRGEMTTDDMRKVLDKKYKMKHQTNPQVSAVDYICGLLKGVVPDNIDMDSLREERLSKYEY